MTQQAHLIAPRASTLFVAIAIGWLTFAPTAHATSGSGGLNIDFCDVGCGLVMLMAAVDVLGTAAVLGAQVGYGVSDAEFPRELAIAEIVFAVPWILVGAYATSESPTGMIPLAIGGWMLLHAISVLSRPAPAPAPEAPRTTPRRLGRTRWHASVSALSNSALASLSFEL